MCLTSPSSLCLTGTLRGVGGGELGDYTSLNRPYQVLIIGFKAPYPPSPYFPKGPHEKSVSEDTGEMEKFLELLWDFRRVWGLLGVQGLGIQVQGLNQGLGFRVQDLGFREQGLGVRDLGFRVELRDSGFLAGFYEGPFMSSYRRGYTASRVSIIHTHTQQRTSNAF